MADDLYTGFAELRYSEKNLVKVSLNTMASIWGLLAGEGYD